MNPAMTVCKFISQYEVLVFYQLYNVRSPYFSVYRDSGPRAGKCHIRPPNKSDP